MASISHYPLVCHLRAEPNQHVLHYRRGKLVAEGAGLAYWFVALSAAVAQVPVEDVETTFLVQERTRDFQDVSVQVRLRYRCAHAQQAAARVNFTINLASGAWTEQPLDRLANFWAERAARPARATVCRLDVTEAVAVGADRVAAAIESELRADAQIGEMGLALVSVHVVRVSPSAEVEKALATPTREAIQTKADEATFARRALAVDKERAIKEAELNNQIELAKKEETLIAQVGANAIAKVRQDAEAERERVEALGERERAYAAAQGLAAEARAAGESRARKATLDVELAAEKSRIAMYEAHPGVAYGLAAQALAGKIQTIQHLNLTPDLLGAAFGQMLRDQAGR
jgi:regulator of protease activity HflC (stomatin/prohibitin superfamily)